MIKLFQKSRSRRVSHQQDDNELYAAFLKNLKILIQFDSIIRNDHLLLKANTEIDYILNKIQLHINNHNFNCVDYTIYKMFKTHIVHKLTEYQEICQYTNSPRGREIATKFFALDQQIKAFCYSRR